jgi:type I restriction enzyme R subunit
MKRAIDDMISEACKPFDNSKFRHELLELKRRNTGKIDTTSIEELAKDRSNDIIFRFKSFVESHKKDIPVIEKISGTSNGFTEISFDDIKLFSKELRKPPYEISPDEVWNAFYRVEPDRVIQLTDVNNPSNIISLTQFVTGKIEMLEPFGDIVDRKFKNWLIENETTGKKFSEEQLEWLNMMKTYLSTFLKIDMMSFNDPPFVNKGGAARAYNLFSTDLNKILSDLNERLI